MNIAAATLNDRERLADALRFYLEHADDWASEDSERDDYERLLAEYSDNTITLPPPRELHEHARASRKGDSPPPAFAQARARIESIDTSRELATTTMHDLIRDAYELGVPLSVLTRWSGYTYRWVQQLVGKP